MRRATLLNQLCDRLQDLVILSATGYRSIIFFRENPNVTLRLIKDEEEEDSLEAAIDVVARNIRK